MFVWVCLLTCLLNITVCITPAGNCSNEACDTISFFLFMWCVTFSSMVIGSNFWVDGHSICLLFYWTSCKSELALYLLMETKCPWLVFLFQTVNKCYWTIAGLVWNHHGLEGKESTYFHLATGKLCSHQMESFVTADLNFSRKFEVGWVIFSK